MVSSDSGMSGSPREVGVLYSVPFDSRLEDELQDPLITTAEGLDRAVDEGRSGGVIGLDTEFVWERTYYPRLGLIQLATGVGQCYLIDTLAVPDLASLGSLLSDRAVVKVLHDAPQDLTILKRATGGNPVNVFDTRVAAGFCGYRASLSLQELLKAMMDVMLDKSETRTDWVKRPLSSRQIDYAIDDVRYLIELRERITELAIRLGREDWLVEELSLLDRGELYEERHPNDQYLRVKGLGRVPSRDLGALRAITAWREEHARKTDVPRRHVMQDEALVRLARLRPRRTGSLSSIRGLPSGFADRYGAEMIDALKEGDQAGVSKGPRPRPPSPEEEVRTEFALAYVRGKSLKEGIDPALVGSRNEVREVVLDNEGSDGLLSGWRRAFVGDELIRVLRGERSLRLDTKTGLPLVVENT
ncbi:MAG: ribonuclease D [Gemmatimonadetes bacterium]|nr:ribonuclease D [Gemmatimonadota bacterium]|tara:strand:+ start:4513 stop:5760 length:1248 start_codon:yes stop_codon:yes gene_type:complete